MSDIKNASLATQGELRIEWALKEMPVINNLIKQLTTERPLQGLRMSACLHITTETANLARTLKAAGADLVLCASNPLSTLALYLSLGIQTILTWRHFDQNEQFVPLLSLNQTYQIHQ